MTASSLRPSDPPTVGTVAETSHRRVLHEMELSVVSDLGSIEEERAARRRSFCRSRSPAAAAFAN
ncbi:MAG: hypothetical protein J0H62_08085 [Rhizobiales bacterium]|nr:hypothetical protein [Hyphomicrobiales bacterium]